MRLTSKGRYAVMAMADLSVHGAHGMVRLQEIAARQSISQPYLEQLFARLKRAGLVEGVRGPNGGYRLARPAAEVSVAEVIAAVDETIATNACRAGGPIGCTGRKERCLTHNLWAALGHRISDFLDEVSLADVAAGRVAPVRADRAEVRA
ncbi:MAG TPA: Rrf2 family transcriptional regulator [Caulobacterales bacterium]|nr:Rrf2 family transcriptional regulator [Caulobacterales bacterium]